MDLKACRIAWFLIFKSTAYQLLHWNKSSLGDDQRDISVVQDNEKTAFSHVWSVNHFLCGDLLGYLFLALRSCKFSFSKLHQTSTCKPPENKPCCSRTVPLLFWGKKKKVIIAYGYALPLKLPSQANASLHVLDYYRDPICTKRLGIVTVLHPTKHTQRTGSRPMP